MAELLEIIQNVMMYQKNGTQVEILLKSSKRIKGKIAEYTGKTLSINGKEILIDDIEDIKEKQMIDLSAFLMNRVIISKTNSETIDAVLIGVNGDDITVVNENGQVVLGFGEIGRITCGDDEILINSVQNQPEEVSTVVEDNNAVKEVSNDEEVVAGTDENADESQEYEEEPEQTNVDVDKPYEPNLFEKALIDGNKSVVGGFVSQSERLSKLGYGDKEIDRVKKAYKSAGWGKDLYSVSTRINLFQLNKNRLAQHYYEKTLNSVAKGSQEFIKTLNVLIQYVGEEDDEIFLAFWKKYSKYLKENETFCNAYIETSLRHRGVRVNDFEKAIIGGDKESVIKYASAKDELEKLNYSEDDIERIKKAVKAISWDKSWYKTATRLFGLQLNKHGLAEVYYESALLIVNKKSEEYTKILNALASIKIGEDNDEYVHFFNGYRDRLKTNTSFCMSYANALISIRAWDKLEKDLPMLREQLSETPMYIDKIQEELDYYKSMPKFDLSNFELISERVSCGSPLYEQEQNLIEKLPDRGAIKALLEIYFFNKEESLYFELADYALFYLQEDKAAMSKLLTMLLSTENTKAIELFLTRIPVLWCNEQLILKYINSHDITVLPEEGDDSYRLICHLKSIEGYKPLSAFENSIVNKDYSTLRNYIDNTYLLEELGYSDDEIEEIVATDIEVQFSDDIYTMRRLLAFQGNKNHTAERYLFEGYYANKIDMCNRLFPLLLEEKRGDLIVSLFEFDKSLNSKMTSLQRFYYLALCITEKDDQVFFEIMEDRWSQYSDDEILERMHRIATDKHDEILAKQIELQINRPRGNEFELALMEADNEAIRKFVKNANLLVELGYTPEEIQKINKIYALGTPNNGTKPGQIANRVYLYQKNKNSLAERLFLNALNEDTPEDVLTDSKALYQIYTGQHNYEMVCRIYEEYLSDEMIEKFNRSYASTYCVALYELGKFEEFLSYFSKNKDNWEGFPLTANLLYICEKLDVHDYDEYIWKNLSSTTYRPDIVTKYIFLKLEKDPRNAYSEKLEQLVNNYIYAFSKEDIENLSRVLKNLNLDTKQIGLPAGGLFVALIDDEKDNAALEAWMDSIFAISDIDKQIDILIKISNVINENPGFFVDKAIQLYVSDIISGVSEYKLGALEEFINTHVTDTENVSLWFDIQKKSLLSGKGTIRSLRYFLETTKNLERSNEFWHVYKGFKRNSVSDIEPEQFFNLIWDYYQLCMQADFAGLKNKIVEELIELSGDFSIDYVASKNIAEACFDCGMIFEGQIYTETSKKIVDQDNRDGVIIAEKSNISYINYLMSILENSDDTNGFAISKGWSKYIRLSEEDKLVIERLRNTIKSSDLWVNDEIDILAKAIICDPSNTMYWKLLQTWLANDISDEKVIGKVLYQLSSQGSKETEEALSFAVANKQKNIALNLMMRLLDVHMPDANIAAQKNLRSMIEMNWFSEETYADKTNEILLKIENNTKLSDAEDIQWNSICAATDLTIATKHYKDYFTIFYDYLTKNCAKQCCVVISEMILEKEEDSIQDAFNCLESSLTEIPYKELVIDLFNVSRERELSQAEKRVLKCIQMDYGNTLGVNDLFAFYCDMCMRDEKQCGLDTIKILIKYTSYDPALSEVAACFLRDETDLESNMSYYNYMYEYLNSIQTDNPVEYAVGAMVCGENYLKLCGKDVRSFRKLIEDRYPQFSDTVKRYQEFCDCIIVGLRTTEYEEFSQILFRAIFSGNWKEVFEYKSSDNTVNNVLKSNIKTDRINIADDYYRSVIKGVVLFILAHCENMWDVIDNSDRARMFWNNIGNTGCDFDYFMNAVQSVDESCIGELVRVWNIDIETLTVFKKYFGKCILSQPNCVSYPQIFNVFVNARSGDIFGNMEVQNYLRTIENESAIDICRSYEMLYIRASGPVVLFSTKRSIDKDSDYENNVFSNYLKRNTSDYRSVSRRYSRFKKKYELLSDMNGISSVEDANDERFDLNEKRQVFFARSLYFYYSVINETIDRETFKKENDFAETINAVTVALSDDAYLKDLEEFVTKKKDLRREVIGILILVEQEKLDSAADSAINKFTGRERGLLCAKIVAAYGKAGKNKESCKKCLKIAKSESRHNTYWIKNYKHCKSIGTLNSNDYLMNDVSEKIKKESDTVSEVIISHEESYQEQSRNTEVETPDEYDEIISYRMPAYIKAIEESKDVMDPNLNILIENWNRTQESVDRGEEPQDTLNELSIEIGLCLIKQSEISNTSDIMFEMFGLIRQYSIHNSYIMTGIHDIFQKYICDYTDLDALSESVYANRDSILHLCYEQDMNQKSRVTQDINAASALIDILTNIANDLSSAMGEETLKERLRVYQEDLYKRTKKISRFRNASNALGKMIQEKINSINFVPYLVISHLATASADNSKNYNWSEKWYEGAETGYVRGVVLNRGGATAFNVCLNVMVNSEHRCTYTIDKITTGRKIPFMVPYKKNDVNKGIVKWGADVIYYDEGNARSRNSNGYGEIKVSLSDEEWGISHVGREKFNTQFAAEGDEFCGRTNELLKLNNLYNISGPTSRYPSLLVTGLRRAGKSSVIKYFKEKLRERENLAPIFVDAQGINGDITNAFFSLTFNELYRTYRKEMEGFAEFKKQWQDVSKSPDWVSQLPTYFMELSELLGGRKIIFILDEMENVFYANHFESAQVEEQFFGMIRSIIQNYQEYVSFIFCGSDKLLTSCLEQKRESQMFQVLQRIYVGRMSINDIRDMFDKYNKEYDIKFGDDAIDSIMYYTNGLIWYTKVIAYNILDRIVDQEHIVRNEIHSSDVNAIVELLIRGDLGAELIDLLDNNFGAKRKAIIRAMAKATTKPNDSVNIEMIISELTKMNYVDSETGEVLGALTDEDLNKNLNVLEKMDFIEKDPHRENSYYFSTELYRLLMLSERKIDKFVMTTGGDDSAR